MSDQAKEKTNVSLRFVFFFVVHFLLVLQDVLQKVGHPTGHRARVLQHKGVRHLLLGQMHMP